MCDPIETGGAMKHLSPECFKCIRDGAKEISESVIPSYLVTRKPYLLLFFYRLVT